MASPAAVLRTFGLLLAGFVACIFGLALPLLGVLPFGRPAWLVAAALALAAAAAPRLLAPLHAGWLRVGHVLAWVNTRVLLGIVFYGVIWPLGLLRRVARQPSIPKRGSPGAATYRVASRTRDRGDFDKPY